MIRLRPHHLLCTQSYEGMGYSPDFIENMNKITDILRSMPDTKIQLVFTTDSLCASCPHMRSEDLCDSQDNVKTFDRRMIEEFGLEEKEYIYSEITQTIDAQMTENRLRTICRGCSWIDCSTCIDRICRCSE